MTHNRATIYSNGIADFQRTYTVKGAEGTKISIPVRQEHLGDVLASLVVMGDVTMTGPPSYQPANQDDGNISINRHHVITSLADQLAGADVVISVGGKTIEGRLLGLQDQQIATSGEPVKQISLAILVEQEIRNFPLSAVETLRFSDPVIQAEIDKALSRSLKEIKPNSTFVELELSAATSNADAVVQYTIPAAAWKISYRILLCENDVVEFHGHAIVDNNTDEDWNDFLISVVIGQPITFSTDLAESKTPDRTHVDVVQDVAIGANEVERVVVMAAGGRSGESADRMVMAPAASPVDVKQKSMARGRGVGGTARVESAEVEESGDFCIFQCATPVSIEANRSAVIPVFQTKLENSAAVLHYKKSSHATRPYRSVRFKNSTEHSLGRGVCTVYDQMIYAGTCVLPATKPDEDTLLPHALETGVSVRKDTGPRKGRRVGLNISEGVVYESQHQKITTKYHINNSRDEGLPFVIDHDYEIAPDSEWECLLLRDGKEPISLTMDQLVSGGRLEFDLLGKDVVTVSISESKTTRSQFKLFGPKERGYYRVDWLYNNIVESNLSLSDDPAIRNCIELHKLMEEKQDQLDHANQEIQKHEKRQERLRKNMKSVEGDQQALRWQNDLVKAEDALVHLEEEHIPKLKIELNTLEKQLRDGLKTLVLEWKE